VTSNGPDQWLAAKRLSIPPGFIASPLHLVVSGRWHANRTTRSTDTSLEQAT
jgi:hypothetical protein